MIVSWGKITRSLFPKGLAFRFFTGTDFNKLSEALSKEPERIKVFFDNVRNSGIPQCDILSTDALSDWETFLALPRNDSLTDDERCERIQGKFTAQGGQGPDYIQKVLQDAGFPVYVLENISSGGTSLRTYVAALGGFSLGGSTLGAYTGRVDPRSVEGTLIAGPPIYETLRNYSATLGGFSLGGATLGEYIGTETIEVDPIIPSDSSKFVFVWFLTGPNGLNDFVDISADRMNDFISLVLQIKPAHTWVIAQVNWI